MQNAYGLKRSLFGKFVFIQYEEAIKCFERVLEFSNRTDGQAFFNLGLVYRKIKNSPAIKAIKQFTDALKYLKFSDQFQALIERGICYR